MLTLQGWLVDKEIEALEGWRAEHERAMQARDLDEAFAFLFEAWRKLCLYVNDLPPAEQDRHEQGLAARRVLERMLELVRDCAEQAQAAGYFDRGYRFTRERVTGLERSLGAAVARGRLPRRATAPVDLDLLPPIQRVPPEID